MNKFYNGKITYPLLDKTERFARSLSKRDTCDKVKQRDPDNMIRNTVHKYLLASCFNKVIGQLYL